MQASASSAAAPAARAASTARCAVGSAARMPVVRISELASDASTTACALVVWSAGSSASAWLSAAMASSS